MKTKRSIIIAFVFLAATLLINYMGGTGLINGLSQKDISDMYPTLLTPKPIAFSIWGLIYLSIIVSFIYLLRENSKSWVQQTVRAISAPFYISCILNMVWIFVFSYELFGLAALITLLLAVTLSILCRRIELNRDRSLILPAFSFGLYTGWALIASVLGVAIWLVSIEWNGFGLSPVIWSIIVLIVAVFLTAFVSLKLRNAIIPIPVAWAYINIGIRHSNIEEFIDANSTIQWTSWIGAIVLVLLAVYIFRKNENSILPRVTIS